MAAAATNSVTPVVCPGAYVTVTPAGIASSDRQYQLFGVAPVRGIVVTPPAQLVHEICAGPIVTVAPASATSAGAPGPHAA